MTRRIRLFPAALAAIATLSATVPSVASADVFGGDREREARREATTGRSEGLKTLGLSLLLPGLGHLELGERNRGLAFLVAEAGFWTAFAVFQGKGSVRKDSYVEMAELYASVPEADGRDDDYYRLLGIWPSSEAYNEVIRREARALYGEDLDAREAYYEANRVAPERTWAWETDAAWDRYRDKRSDSQSAFRMSRNMLGLAAANRVVAMVDATLLRRKNGDRQVRLQLVPGDEPASAQLRLTCLLP